MASIRMAVQPLAMCYHEIRDMLALTDAALARLCIGLPRKRPHDAA